MPPFNKTGVVPQQFPTEYFCAADFPQPNQEVIERHRRTASESSIVDHHGN